MLGLVWPWPFLEQVCCQKGSSAEGNSRFCMNCALSISDCGRQVLGSQVGDHRKSCLSDRNLLRGLLKWCYVLWIIQQGTMTYDDCHSYGRWQRYRIKGTYASLTLKQTMSSISRPAWGRDSNSLATTLQEPAQRQHQSVQLSAALPCQQSQRQGHNSVFNCC